MPWGQCALGFEEQFGEQVRDLLVAICMCLVAERCTIFSISLHVGNVSFNVLEKHEKL